jgi:ABC-type branched-subunit amino acid transport system substrate-binding protein
MQPRFFRQLVTLTAFALPAGLGAQAAADTLRVGVVLTAAPLQLAHAESIARGVQLGTEEASRTAALFGVTMQVVRSGDTDTSTVAAVQRMIGERAAAVVAAGDPDECDALAEIAATRRVVLLTLSCGEEFQRADACARTSFHLAPSDAIRAHARDLASRDSRHGAPSHARVAVWHHSLSRFGAEQLNERFRRRFGVEMDSSAWSAWLAMKILAETALRARTSQGRELARYLVRRDSRFDGHKGEPLSFEPRTGELRQPLYLVVGSTASDERIAAEVTGGMLFPPSATGRHEAAECASENGPGTR